MFSTAKAIADENALRLLVEFSAVAPEHRVLDGACGGGLVVCAFAPHVREAVGSDVTPAMLEHARLLTAQKQVNNVGCPVSRSTNCAMRLRICLRAAFPSRVMRIASARSSLPRRSTAGSEFRSDVKALPCITRIRWSCSKRVRIDPPNA